ncbi:hypothetical protein ACMX9J_16095 [Priestia sp. RMT2NF4]|uniref:hypothetical protein n=1 Tax=Priestia sp. RMT2NF4 TaxID=3398394 RepID=UPI003A4C5A09
MNEIPINKNDVLIENVDSTKGYQTQGSVKRLKIKKSKINSIQHGIHINSANVEDIYISGNQIIAEKYGVLTNIGSENGKNLNIYFNKIYSRVADAVQLNNPTNTLDRTSCSFKQVKIIGNTLIADEYGLGDSAGMAIGIANTRDVVVISNITEKSRREALHIEASQKNVLAIGNIFNGCISDGCRILTKGGAKPPTISSNHFIKHNIAKKDIGIWRVYDGNGSLEVNISQNYVRGFDIGLWMDGAQWVNADGCIIDDCNVAVKTGNNTLILGTIISKNSPVLIQGKSGSVVEKVVSEIPPTKVLEYIGTSGQLGATLKSLISQTGPVLTTKGITNTFTLFPLANIMQGKLTIRNGGINKLILICDITWDGTNLAVNNIVKKISGSFGDGVTFTNNSNQLSFSIYCANAFTTNFNYEFEGMYYVE